MVKLKGGLGPLERSVMEVFWSGDAAERSVRDVIASGVGRTPAYTTIMTVLDRLWRKGFLRRRRVGKAYRYRARISRAEYLTGLVEEVLEGTDERVSVLLGFVRRADEGDLNELRAAIRELDRSRRRSPRR